MDNTHHTLTVRVGDEFRLKLGGCLGPCGYDWFVKHDKGLRLLARDTVPPAKIMPGASSTLVYRFQALSTGQHKIMGQMRRPWLPVDSSENSDIETWTVTVIPAVLVFCI